MFGFYGSELVIFILAAFTGAIVVIATVIDIFYGLYLNRKYRKKD